MISRKFGKRKSKAVKFRFLKKYSRILLLCVFQSNSEYCSGLTEHPTHSTSIEPTTTMLSHYIANASTYFISLYFLVHNILAQLEHVFQILHFVAEFYFPPDSSLSFFISWVYVTIVHIHYVHFWHTEEITLVTITLEKILT